MIAILGHKCAFEVQDSSKWSKWRGGGKKLNSIKLITK